MNRSRGALLLMAGRVVAALFSLLTLVVLARLLSRQDYGTYQLIWLMYLVVLPFVSLGLPASITYFAPTASPERQKALLIQTGAALFAAGLVVGLIGFAVGALLEGSLEAPGLARLLALFVLFPAVSFPMAIVDAFLLATRRPTAAMVTTIGSAVIQFGAIAGPVLLGAGLDTAILALTASGAVRLVVIAAYLLWEFRHIPLGLNVPLLGQQLRYSLPLGVSGILSTLTLQIDRILIAGFFGASMYAVYANGATEVPFVGIVTGSVMTVLTPEFVRLLAVDAKVEALRLWNSSTTKVAMFFFPLTALLVAFAPSVILVLFSDRYIEAVPIFMVFSLILPTRITTYGAMLIAAGLSRVVMVAAIAALVVKAVLGVALLPIGGLLGGALSTLIAVYAVAGWQLARCRELLGVPWRDVFPWGALSRIAAVSVASASLAWGATVWMPHGVVRLAVGTAVFTFACLGGLLAIRSTRVRLAEIWSAARGVALAERS